MANCCRNENSSSELNTSASISDNIFQDEQLLNKIPTVKDSISGINYITSKESYQILIRKIPKIIFTKKLSQNLSTSELIQFINKSINWILEAKTEKNDKKIIKYILMIKNYTKFGTTNILKELNNIRNLIRKEDDNFLLQSLSDWIMLIQLIMFMNNSNNNNNKGSDYSCKNLCTAYDINLWYNRNLEKVIKNYCFDGCFFLIQIKIKYKSINKYSKFITTSFDMKINNDTKNEVKKLFCLIEDFVKELSKD